MGFKLLSNQKLSKLLFNGNQEVNESIIDYVNRIAYLNGFSDPEKMLAFFWRQEWVKKEFINKERNTTSLRVETTLKNAIKTFGYKKKYRAGGKSFHEFELVDLMEIITGKDCIRDSYPITTFEEHKFEFGLDKLKFCKLCWSDTPFIRFYWNYHDSNYCHFHKTPLTRPIDKGCSYSDESLQINIDEDFICSLLKRLNPDNCSKVVFFEFEQEMFLFETERKISRMLCDVFDFLYSKKLNFDKVAFFLGSGGNIHKSPRERIESIISSLSDNMSDYEEVFRLYVFLFLGYKHKSRLYNYCFLDRSFKEFSYLNLSFYQDDLIAFVFDSKYFDTLIHFVKNHSGRLIELNCKDRKGRLFDACVSNKALLDLKPQLFKLKTLQFFDASNYKISLDAVHTYNSKYRYNFEEDYGVSSQLFISNLYPEIIDRLIFHLFNEIEGRKFEAPYVYCFKHIDNLS